MPVKTLDMLLPGLKPLEIPKMALAVAPPRKKIIQSVLRWATRTIGAQSRGSESVWTTSGVPSIGTTS
jgi:hypothetical protein